VGSQKEAERRKRTVRPRTVSATDLESLLKIDPVWQQAHVIKIQTITTTILWPFYRATCNITRSSS